MKKILLATAAFLAFMTTTFAADLAVKAPAVAALPVAFNWTGCYVGIEGGGNWGRSDHVAQAGPNTGLPITGRFDLSGGLAGGTVGCNYQFNSFVIGIENDISWTNKRGSAFDQLPFNPAALSSTRENWIDTLRGRAGVAWDKFYLYGTGGAAWAGTEASVTNFGTVTDSRTRNGWVAGVGGEWAAWTGPWGALTFKLEYLHADFGTGRYIDPSVVVAPGATVVTRDVRLTDDIFRAGMNVKFNWGGPVIAKY